MSLEVQMARAATAQSADASIHMGVSPPTYRKPENLVAAAKVAKSNFPDSPPAKAAANSAAEQSFQVAQSGQGIYMPSTKGLPSEAYPAELLSIGSYGAGPGLAASHETTLKQALGHVHGVSSGAKALKELRQWGKAPTVFMAVTDPKKFGPSEVAKVALLSSGEPIVTVNTTRLSKIFAGDQDTATTPAKAVTGLFTEIVRADQEWKRKVGDAPKGGPIADDFAATMKADAFYGELAGETERRTFRYRLSRDLYAKQLVDSFEEVTKTWWKVNVSGQSGGVRLGAHLVETGGGGETPLRLLLNTLDTRNNWAPVDNLNALMAETHPHLTLNKNSLALLDILTGAQSRGELKEMANNYKRANGPHEKFDETKLIEVVKEEIKSLVDQGAYSKEDVAELIQGLSLPAPLRTFFDDLLGRTPAAPSPLPNRQSVGPIAKLQLTTAS